jgi:hypothetical protein
MTGLEMLESPQMRLRPSRAPESAAQLSIVYRRIDSLKPNPKNPRAHNRSQRGKLAKSIRTFGFLVPVLVDRDDNVITGHGRLEGATDAGLGEVPTIRIEHLTPRQIQAYTIADNRLTELSVWNDTLLAQQLKELSDLAPEIDLEDTGFTIGEIDMRIEELGGDIDEDHADHLPAPSERRPTTQLGDLWHLRSSKVLCGSALENTSYERLMGGERASAAFLDPPYNVRVADNVSGLGAVKHRDFLMASGEMNEAQFIEFLGKFLGLLPTHCASGAICFMCMDWRHLHELLTATRATGFRAINLCVWSKNCAGMGSLYARLPLGNDQENAWRDADLGEIQSRHTLLSDEQSGVITCLAAIARSWDRGRRHRRRPHSSTSSSPT